MTRSRSAAVAVTLTLMDRAGRSAELHEAVERSGNVGKSVLCRCWLIAGAGVVLSGLSGHAHAAPDALIVDRVDAQIEAVVATDLTRVEIVARYRWWPAKDVVGLVVAKVADRALRFDAPLSPAAEPQLFASGYARGGFEALVIEVDGQPCRARAEQIADMPSIVCEGAFSAGTEVGVQIRTVLSVPERYGALGRHKRQLTLLGGWFPALGRADRPPPVGSVRARVRIPADSAAVLGPRYVPHVPRTGAEGRWIEARNDATSMPLIVLPARTGARGVAGGQVRWISGRRYTTDGTALRQAELTVAAVEGALSVLNTDGLPSVPLLVVEAPLRRHLARAGPGVVLVSDRAFRLPPFERFFQFHQFPIVREILTAWAYDQVRRDGYRGVSADAVGAFLRDRFVAASSGQAEDLFDVLSIVSFLPAVDSLLYAPQTAFIGAYFRLADESDPLRANLIDPPSAWPRGRIVYAKLADRVGPQAAGASMHRLALGEPLPRVLGDALGADSVFAFLSTWLGPYPPMQYALDAWGSRPVRGSECTPASECHAATVTVRHRGAAVVEPVQLRLTDDDGGRRLVWTDTSSAALRTVTATLAHPLDLVELDPRGRIAEAPTVEMPSPKFDNRSRSKWRVLLNNFSFGASPTAGTLNTSLDLAISRVRDVHWRFGLSAGFGPDAISVSGRALRRFGPRVTPDRLERWIGVSAGAQRLRSDFADEADASYALTSNLFFGSDDRQTAWAPEPGTGLRAVLTYNHVFGRLSRLDSNGESVTRDALALTLAALKSWRIEGRHQLSLRASMGSFLAGRPQSQLLYFLGGRTAVRGYIIDETVGRYRAIASGEWVHTLLGEANENVVELVWATKLDGALFADVAAIGDDLDGDFARRLRADVGYGFRIYLDYFGIRPGVMAVEVAWPLLDDRGRFRVGSPAVYIDFSQSFFIF